MTDYTIPMIIGMTLAFTLGCAQKNARLSAPTMPATSSATSSSARNKHLHNLHYLTYERQATNLPLLRWQSDEPRRRTRIERENGVSRRHNGKGTLSHLRQMPSDFEVYDPKSVKSV